MQNNEKLTALLELANNYPSPHNGQPMVLEPVADGALKLCFDTSRGLTATPISYLFSFVSIGVFVRHLELCGQALGHAVVVHLDLPNQTAMTEPGLLDCGRVFIDFDVQQPDDVLQKVILDRQTSRKKYTAGLSEVAEQKVLEIAAGYDMRAAFVTPQQAQQVIWLNQRAVFDDFFNQKVREELNHWFRYTAEEKHSKKDGLAYDCMELKGAAMRTAVKHYKWLHWPVVSQILKQYYLRTMKDSSSVGYLTAPFESEQQAYEIGRCIIDIWIELSRKGQYLHPFGTIVSNDAAHADFTKLVGLSDESRDRNYVAFIFRTGASQVPVESDRIPVKEHLFAGGQA